MCPVGGMLGRVCTCISAESAGAYNLWNLAGKVELRILRGEL